jgi:UDP-glucose 4-epimerase
VVVLDNLSKGHRETIPNGAGFVKGDLLDAGRLTRVLDAGFEGVLHLVALSLVGESVEQPERYYRTNVLGTLNLLEAMRLAGVPRLVFSSTAAPSTGNLSRCPSRKMLLPVRPTSTGAPSSPPMP